MNHNKKQNNSKYYLQLTLIIAFFLVIGFGLYWLGNNWVDVQKYINNKLYDTQLVVADGDFENYREIVLDGCDTTTPVKKKVKANISIDGQHPYYSYTDEQSRVVYVEAKQLYNKKQINREGRYCKAIFPSNKNEKAKQSIDFKTNSGDDRGHLIADRFNGVANAYNITAQDADANRKEYTKLEDQLNTAIEKGSEVTDFQVFVKYKDVTQRRPEYYEIQFKINNRPYHYILYNDGRPLEKK